MKLNLNKYFIKKNIQRPLIVAEVSANHCGKKSIFSHLLPQQQKMVQI
jgi:hypothetical protein